MTDWTDLVTEQTITASPVWLRLVDTFTTRAPASRIEIAVQRRDGGQWVPAEVPYVLKSSGDLAFVNLGRVAPTAAGAQFDLRITLTARQMIAETATGEPALTATITTWAPDAPPVVFRQLIRCYPGPDYPFGPGVPQLSGRVLDQADHPVPRARVTVTEQVLGAPRTEEVRTNDDGWFRLPLRWSAGSTQIDADRQDATGSVTINVPADLGSVSLITLS